MRKMISIIIPVYNSDATIDRCVKSVLGQTYDGWELILVNDGSKDGSLQKCISYAGIDQRISVIDKNNGGVSSARNAGLAKARGEYVMFLDSDDYMMEGMCETLLLNMSQNQSDLVVCGTFENGGSVWAPKLYCNYAIDDLKRDFIGIMQNELLSPCWNKIYRRSAIVDGFREDTSFGEDLIFVLDYLDRCCKVTFIPDALMFHDKGNPLSLASCVSPCRLMEIEKYFRRVASFCSSYYSFQELSGKYVRDIAVYSRMLIKNTKMSSADLFMTLDDWGRISALKSINLLVVEAPLMNRLLLFCLKHHCWKFAFWQVNKRFS